MPSCSVLLCKSLDTCVTVCFPSIDVEIATILPVHSWSISGSFTQLCNCRLIEIVHLSRKCLVLASLCVSSYSVFSSVLHLVSSVFLLRSMSVSSRFVISVLDLKAIKTFHYSSYRNDLHSQKMCSTWNFFSYLIAFWMIWSQPNNNFFDPKWKTVQQFAQRVRVLSVFEFLVPVSSTFEISTVQYNSWSKI